MNREHELRKGELVFRRRNEADIDLYLIRGELEGKGDEIAVLRMYTSERERERERDDHKTVQ